MESAMAEFDGLIAPPPVDKKPDVVPVKPAEPKPADKKPDTKVAPVKISGEAALRKRLAEVERERDDAKTSAQTELGKLNGKLKELEGKRYWTPEDEKKHGEMEKRQQELESDLYSRDFKESPEFKNKFQKKADKVFNTVTKEIKGMTVKFTDGDQEKERPATIGDFNRIRALGDSLSEQRKLAKSLFGEDADIVLSHARELSSIEEDANEEITTRKNTYAETRKEAEERLANEAREYGNHKATYEKLLVEKYPQFFGEDATNPQATEALKKGLDFVDATVSNAAKLTVEERAMKNSAIRFMAGSFQRNQVKIQQLEAQLAERDEKIGKLHKSDPGSGGDTNPSTSGEPKKPMGISGMAAEFDKIVV
jgi:hypothetical protein